MRLWAITGPSGYEAKVACKVTGARPLFLNQIDGSTEVNKGRYQEMREILERENPDHWSDICAHLHSKFQISSSNFRALMQSICSCERL